MLSLTSYIDIDYAILFALIIYIIFLNNALFSEKKGEGFPGSAFFKEY